MLLDLSIEMYPHYPEGVVILSHPPFVFYSIKASMYVEGVWVWELFHRKNHQDLMVGLTKEGEESGMNLRF